MPLPKDATAQTDAWAKIVTPTAAQFAAQFYAPDEQYAATNNLALGHLTGIAHREFTAADGNIADVVLMSFATDADASTRYYNITYQLASETRGTEIDLPGFSDDEADASQANAPNANGYIFTRAMAHKPGSRIAVQFDLYSKTANASADLLSWSE